MNWVKFNKNIIVNKQYLAMFFIEDLNEFFYCVSYFDGESWYDSTTETLIDPSRACLYYMEIPPINQYANLRQKTDICFTEDDIIRAYKDGGWNGGDFGLFDIDNYK